jgi:vanillate O-demethylase ferredoxin subunit
MAYQLHADGQDFQFMITGAARNQAPLAEVLHAAPFVHRVTWCPAAPPGRCRPEPAGHVHTWPTWIHATLAAEPADAHLYACGPRPFIAAVLDAARQLEWDERRLHRQHLGLVPPDTELGPPFDVVLSRHGLHLHVPADRTLAEMLQAHGIDVPTVCGVGVCGACLVPVRDGGIDHRDYLKGADRRSGNRMAACCSRAASGILVLDL